MNATKFEDGRLYGMLLHLGGNMWSNRPIGAPSRFKGLLAAPWQLSVPVMRPFFDQAFDQMPEAKKAMDDWLRVT